MGKKNKKKGKDSDEFKFKQRMRSGMYNEDDMSLFKHYDIDPKDFERRGRPGQYDNEGRGHEALRDELQKRMNNDYSTRRSFEAAAMAGDEDARKYAEEGFKGSEGIHGGFQALKALKEKYGTGGGMHGARNKAGLTQRIVDYDRKMQTEGYDDKYMLKEDYKEPEAAAAPEPEKPAELSDRLKSVNERFSQASAPMTFKKDNDAPPAQDDQQTAARNFLNDYRIDVTRGAGLRSDIKTGVSNAARFIRDIYGR